MSLQELHKAIQKHGIDEILSIRHKFLKGMVTKEFLYHRLGPLTEKNSLRSHTTDFKFCLENQAEEIMASKHPAANPQ